MNDFPKNVSKSDRKYVNILGVRVDSSELVELLAKIAQKMSSEAKFYIVTPNPEIILKAQDDPKLLSILNSADFSIPDGVGLKFAVPSLSVVHGRELMANLCKMANEKKWKVFLLGGSDGVAELAANKLKIKNLKLKIDYATGPMLDNEANPISEVDVKIQSDILDKIGIIQPDILFVGFGAPKQEKWIYKNLSKLKAKCIMTVGGGIDYIAGVAKLPPAWMEKAGLEWLWRLINEPWRFARIISAIIIFPLKVLKSRLNGY